MRASTFSLPPPGWETPERSPLMSAAKTGTPILLNASASTCSDTVLPVPGRPCDEAVPVGHLRQEVDVDRARRSGRPSR